MHCYMLTIIAYMIRQAVNPRATYKELNSVNISKGNLFTERETSKKHNHVSNCIFFYEMSFLHVRFHAI